MPEPIRLLCAGDLHLGRYPSRIEGGQQHLTVASVWERFVKTAITSRVDAIVLTGDIVDAENKVFEALSTLEDGLRRLRDADIPVIAVAGNHDFDAFPRVINNLGEDALTYLGHGGEWQEHILEVEGKFPVRFVGWSFPERYVRTSPLDTFPEAPSTQNLFQSDTSAGATIGVMHGDLDAPNSPYAPLQSATLGRKNVHTWLLGHIHQWRKVRDGQQLQLYTGSLQPLHPNETGKHGAWFIQVSEGGRVKAELQPLASLHYREIQVDVSACEGKGDVEQTAIETVRDKTLALADEMPELRQVVYRMRFTGRTSLASHIDDWAPDFTDRYRPRIKGAEVRIDSYTLDLRPAHNLEKLAESSDPPGELASLLLALENGTDTQNKTAREALRRAKNAIGTVYNATGYEPLRRDEETQNEPDDEQIIGMLRQRGMVLLDALLNQQEEAHHG